MIAYVVTPTPMPILVEFGRVGNSSPIAEIQPPCDFLVSTFFEHSTRLEKKTSGQGSKDKVTTRPNVNVNVNVDLHTA